MQSAWPTLLAVKKGHGFTKFGGSFGLQKSHMAGKSSEFDDVPSYKPLYTHITDGLIVGQ